MIPPAAPRAGEPFRAVMMSRTAAWQCALIPRGLRLRCVMSLLETSDGRTARVERSIPRRRAFPAEPEGGWSVGGEGFQLRLKRDRSAWFLSGSIEDRALGTWLWDIRLAAVPGLQEGPLYRAEGRIVLPEGEILFPPAVSFLDGALSRSAAVMYRRDPPLALRTAEAGDSFRADASGVKALPSLLGISRTETGWTCRFDGAQPALRFEPWPEQPGGLFHLNLGRGAGLDTRFGFWRGAWPETLSGIEGFVVARE